MVEGVAADDVRSGMVSFERKWHGYDPDEVDPVLRAAERVAFSDDARARAEMARTLRDTDFRVVRRGYDRVSVDAYSEVLIKQYLLVDRLSDVYG